MEAVGQGPVRYGIVGLVTYRHTGALDAEQLRGLLDDHLGIDV